MVSTRGLRLFDGSVVFDTLHRSEWLYSGFPGFGDSIEVKTFLGRRTGLLENYALMENSVVLEHLGYRGTPQVGNHTEQYPLSTYDERGERSCQCITSIPVNLVGPWGLHCCFYGAKLVDRVSLRPIDIILWPDHDELERDLVNYSPQLLAWDDFHAGVDAGRKIIIIQR